MKMPSLEIGSLTAEFPIIQGGLAIRISMASLAAAVAEEGGIGLIAGSGMHPPELAAEIRKARKLTDGIIGVNIMVAAREFKQLVQVALREKVDLVVAGAGFSRDVFKWCAKAGTPFAPIISHERLVGPSLKYGASAIIVEGKEAGGHLGTAIKLKKILPSILETVGGRIPVIAAGGVLEGSDIAEMLAMGASGVQMGTRFAASDESSACNAFKQAYVDAGPNDVVIIESPVGLPGRALLTPFTQKILDGTVPPPNTLSKCVACMSADHCKKNYCIVDALVNAQTGDDMDNAVIFCGERVGEIKKILPVRTIMHDLVQGFERETRDWNLNKKLPVRS